MDNVACENKIYNEVNETRLWCKLQNLCAIPCNCIFSTVHSTELVQRTYVQINEVTYLMAIIKWISSLN